MIPELVWVNGREAAQVSALERGLHFGDGLFETIACVGGRARFLEVHLQRLAAGCARLGLQAPDIPAVRNEVRQLAAPCTRAIIKVLLTRGAAAARGYAVSGVEETSRISLRYVWPPEDPQASHAGVRVRIAAVRLGENPALAGLKHCNRLEQVLARREWADAAVAEALMFSSSGAVISGTMSNLFMVRDGKLCTPRVDRCGVAGVMRHVVLAAAADAGIAVEERVLDSEDLERAQELFLTNALIGIHPVRELAGRALPPGSLTRRLQERLAPLLTEGRLPREAGDG
ncbi:MAG TPA: aminodeoxychorismate lyase [Steroidobacteraceae bacterium]